MIKIIKAYFIESPLFVSNAVQLDPEGYPCNEDAGPVTKYNLQVVAECEDGTRRTHYQTFDSWDIEGVTIFVDTVNRRGHIKACYWEEGTSWDHYATPQSYEEEKAEALFNHGARA